MRINNIAIKLHGAIKIAVFIAIFSAQVTASFAKGAMPVESCLRARQCEIIILGALTPSPAITFVVYKNLWSSWSFADRATILAHLAQEALKARKNPEKYTNIPKSAPVYPRVVAAIQKLSQYSIMLSESDGNKSALRLDKEIQRGNLSFP